MGVALASGPPDMKEGLWSLTRQTTDNPGGTKDAWAPITICRSRAYDEYVLELAKKVPGCATVSEGTEGNTYSAESRCVVGKTVLDTKSKITVQGGTESHGESHTTYTPPLEGKSETIMTSDAKYLGGCPAGMQPGDRKNADGTIVHGWKH